MLPNGSIHHKLILPILRCRQSCLRHLTKHPVHTLTKLLHQFMVAHIQRYLGVAREMHLSDIVRPYQARQYTRTLHRHVVVKQLHLDIRTQNAIVSVTNRIHAKFRPTELRILRVRPKPPILSQICMFLDLRLHKSQHIVCQLQYRASENLILHHVHLRSHLGFRAVIADKPYLRPLEEPLRILSEQQHSSPRQCTVILHTDGYPSAIRIRECDDGNCQRLRVDASALPVKHLILRRFLYLFYCHIILISICGTGCTKNLHSTFQAFLDNCPTSFSRN